MATVYTEVAEATVEPSQAKPTHVIPAYNQKQEILEIGTGEFIAQTAQKPKQQVETADGDITLNFQDTDIREFIKVILGDVLGANYLIDPKVGGSAAGDLQAANETRRTDGVTDGAQYVESGIGAADRHIAVAGAGANPHEATHVVDRASDRSE